MNQLLQFQKELLVELMEIVMNQLLNQLFQFHQWLKTGKI